MNERKLLGEVAQFHNKQRVPLSSMERAERRGSYPYYGAAGVIDFVDDFLFDGTFVLIGEDGTVQVDGGHPMVTVARGQFWVNNHAHVVRASSGRDIDTEFLRYALVDSDVVPFLSGSVQPKLSMANAKQLPVWWPDESTRSRIVRTLGALDDLIEVNRGLIRDIDDLGMAQLILALPASLREIDGHDTADGWSVSTIAEMSSVLETGSRPKGGVSSIRSGIPSVGAESINGLARFDYAKVKYVPKDFFHSMTKGHVASGDVLVYKDGGTPGSFTPKVAQYGEGFPFQTFAINEHVFRVSVKAPISNAFLYFWLKSDRMMAEMHRAGTGAAIPGINKTAFGGLPVAVPPLHVSATLCPALDVLSSSALHVANEIRDLERTRDELLPLLMSGRVRVSEEVAA